MQIISSDKNVRNDTVNDLKEFNNQSLYQHKLKKENSWSA